MIWAWRSREFLEIGGLPGLEVAEPSFSHRKPSSAVIGHSGRSWCGRCLLVIFIVLPQISMAGGYGLLKAFRKTQPTFLGTLMKMVPSLSNSKPEIRQDSFIALVNKIPGVCRYSGVNSKVFGDVSREQPRACQATSFSLVLSQ